MSLSKRCMSELPCFHWILVSAPEMIPRPLWLWSPTSSITIMYYVNYVSLQIERKDMQGHKAIQCFFCKNDAREEAAAFARCVTRKTNRPMCSLKTKSAVSQSTSVSLFSLHLEPLFDFFQCLTQSRPTCRSLSSSFWPGLATNITKVIPSEVNVCEGLVVRQCIGQCLQVANVKSDANEEQILRAETGLNTHIAYLIPCKA